MGEIAWNAPPCGSNIQWHRLLTRNGGRRVRLFTSCQIWPVVPKSHEFFATEREARRCVHRILHLPAAGLTLGTSSLRRGFSGAIDATLLIARR